MDAVTFWNKPRIGVAVVLLAAICLFVTSFFKSFSLDSAGISHFRQGMGGGGILLILILAISYIKMRCCKRRGNHVGWDAGEIERAKRASLEKNKSVDFQDMPKDAAALAQALKPLIRVPELNAMLDNVEFQRLVWNVKGRFEKHSDLAHVSHNVRKLFTQLKALLGHVNEQLKGKAKEIATVSDLLEMWKRNHPLDIDDKIVCLEKTIRKQPEVFFLLWQSLAPNITTLHLLLKTEEEVLKVLGPLARLNKVAPLGSVVQIQIESVLHSLLRILNSEKAQAA